MAKPPHIFRAFANGLRDIQDGRFFPFKCNTFAPGTDILKRKQNIRYFIKTISLSYSAVAGDAGTSIEISGNVENETFVLAKIVRTAADTSHDNISIEINQLLDIESTVDFTATNISSASGTITWSEVDDVV